MSESVSLKPYHTFGLEVLARQVEEFHSLEEFIRWWYDDRFSDVPKLILGGGSNVLFTSDFPGLVLVNKLKGIRVVQEDEHRIELEVASGENWHQWVLHCVENGWGGIENLSLIPGTVGAAPMQNIGAYGVEVKEVITEVEYWDLEKRELFRLNNTACRFAYRESIFKHELKGKVLITNVRFRLDKQRKPELSYGAIQDTLKEMGITHPGLKEVSQAVIHIRQSKLPDPAQLGNAGSFFKNPEISVEEFEPIKRKHPEIPSYPMPDGRVKIPAGWLIEQAGWKGKQVGRTGSHARQALVLVNYGGASGEEVKALALEIIRDVREKFGIILHPEVNFI